MSFKHGESAGGGGDGRTPEYVAWTNMIGRCENASRPDYANYGGRGIRVCARWREDYLAFLADMGRRPSDTYSIDRVDVNGNYEPGNCRWATAEEQQSNRRDNRLLAIGDETVCLAELSRRSGIDKSLIRYRLAQGRDVSESVAPVRTATLHAYGQEILTVEAIAAREGIPVNSLYRRLARHGDIASAIAGWRSNGQGKNKKSARPRSSHT